MAAASFLSLLFFLLAGGLAPPPPQVQAQQPYGAAVNDCNKQHNDTGLLGYFCGAGSAPSCPAFLTFTARPPYTNLSSIASLLGADAAGLAAANSVAEAAPLAAGTRVLVPAACACTATPAGRFYQRNATFVARPGDSLLIIATEPLQGLSTCQAIQQQGLRPGETPSGLLAGQRLAVPLRCACPSAAQAAAGARFLVTYPVVEGDDLSTVAARFGVDAGDVAAANQLQSPFTIFPFTTLLIPVRTQPNASLIQSPPPSPPPPPAVAAPPPPKKSSGHAGIYIGVGVAVAAIAVIAAAGAFLALKSRRRRRRAAATLAAAEAAKKKEGKGNDKSTSSGFTSSGGEFSVSFSEAFSGISVTDIKSSLKVYAYAELKAATDDFSPDRRIGGSVYRAAFGGDAAAVEVVDRDVSTEVEIMRKINHLNLIRLIGLCHHRGQWYLITEYAEHGALRDRLLAGAGSGAAAPLTWAQRVQVALDIAEGLRYLHEYARPPCVHMDVSSGSVLLAGDWPRAKLRGFGAARAITSGTGAGGEVLFTMTSRIAGTRGYIAPEYLEHGVVSPKADVYSLGVVLLELVTGKDAEELVGDGVGDPFAAMRELAEERDGAGGDAVVHQRLEELVDPALPAGSCPQDAVVMMVRLIERCVRRDAAGRPTSGEVAQQLLKLSGVAVVRWRSSPESPHSSGSERGLMY